jgi:hypothetical protein
MPPISLICFATFAMLLLVLPSQAQSGCEPKLLERLSELPAYLFVPTEMADTLSWLAKSGWEIAPPAESSWHLSQLQAHLDELVAIEPQDSANPVCAAQQRQFMQRAGWVLLLPEGEIKRARAAGFDLIEQEGTFEAKGTPLTSWGPSMGLIWGAIEAYPTASPARPRPTDLIWYHQPRPENYAPADSVSGKLRLEGVAYGWVRKK